MDQLATAHLSQPALARAQAEQFAKQPTSSKEKSSPCLDTMMKIIIVVAAVLLLITALVTMKLGAALILALPIVTVGGVGFVYSDKLAFFLSNTVFVLRSPNITPSGGRSYTHHNPSRGATYGGANVPFGGGTHFPGGPGPYDRSDQTSGRGAPFQGQGGHQGSSGRTQFGSGQFQAPPPGSAPFGGPPPGGNTQFGSGYSQGSPRGSGFGAGGPPSGAPGSGHTAFGGGHQGPPSGGGFGGPPSGAPGENTQFGSRKPGDQH